jgi:hypothetical protein
MKYLAALLLTLGMASSGVAQSPFAFRETTPDALELSENGKPVFVYNFGQILAKDFPESMRRGCYLHPVYAPDGTQITDDFNADHPHHRGISWMWPVVTVDGKTGDMWTLKGGFQDRFVAWKTRETQAGVARLAVENGWFDGTRKFVKEDVEILTHAVAADKRVLDFTLRLEATDQPVQVAGTPDGKKGFGGFGFRFAPRDGGTAKTVLRTDEGIMEKDGVLSRHPWAEISGTFQGKAEKGRVDDDSSNPGYPKNGWLMRHGFGSLNVSYPGLEPVTLVPGKPLVLKYRVTLYSGKAAE